MCQPRQYILLFFGTVISEKGIATRQPFSVVVVVVDGGWIAHSWKATFIAILGLPFYFSSAFLLIHLGRNLFFFFTVHPSQYSPFFPHNPVPGLGTSVFGSLNCTCMAFFSFNCLSVCLSVFNHAPRRKRKRERRPCLVKVSLLLVFAFPSFLSASMRETQQENERKTVRDVYHTAISRDIPPSCFSFLFARDGCNEWEFSYSGFVLFFCLRVFFFEQYRFLCKCPPPFFFWMTYERGIWDAGGTMGTCLFHGHRHGRGQYSLMQLGFNVYDLRTERVCS